MTAGDFIPANDPDFDAGPNYPVVFGITLTPTIFGALAAVFGVAVAAYVFLNAVQPELQRNQDLEAKVKEKQAQVAEQAALRQQIADANAKLQTVQQQRKDVLALFSNEKTLNTLLLDLDRLVRERNAQVASLRQAKLNTCPPRFRNNITEYERSQGDLVARAALKSFAPDTKGSGVVNDNTFGPQVNGKLGRQVVSVEFQGNFNQTLSVFRAIERLQPLLLVNNLKVAVGAVADGKFKNYEPVYTLTPAGAFTLVSCQPEPVLATSFRLQAPIPIATEPAAKPAAPAKQ